MGARAVVEDRAALARAALRRAEERTGTAAFAQVTAVPGPRPPGGASAPGPAAPGLAPVPTAPGAVGPDVAAPAGGRARSARLSARAEPLPVAPGLAALLPGGVLERGRVHVVSGSTSLVVALLAEASRAGSWLAVVGLEQIGLLAAQQAGLDLSRVALVPTPGPDSPVVVAALLDGMDMVLVGPRAVLDHADRRRLTARARERGVALLSTEDWPGAHLRLTAVRSPWAGLGRGHGRLSSRTLTVHRTGRGQAGAGEVLSVELPGAVPGAGAPRTGSAADPTAGADRTAAASTRTPDGARRGGLRVPGDRRAG